MNGINFENLPFGHLLKDAPDIGQTEELRSRDSSRLPSLRFWRLLVLALFIAEILAAFAAAIATASGLGGVAEGAISLLRIALVPALALSCVGLIWAEYVNRSGFFMVYSKGDDWRSVKQGFNWYAVLLTFVWCFSAGLAWPSLLLLCIEGVLACVTATIVMGGASAISLYAAFLGLLCHLIFGLLAYQYQNVALFKRDWGLVCSVEAISADDAVSAARGAADLPA